MLGNMECSEGMIYTPKEETLIATGHTRIVNGYYEIPGDKIVDTNIFIPWDCKWRTSMGKVYYLEYRTKDLDNVMIYFQMRLVKYADYKLHHYYVKVEDVILK